MSYEQTEAGKWIQPTRSGYLMACCDCGLVHKIDFRIYRGRVQMRVWRDNPATSAHRFLKIAELTDELEKGQTGKETK